MNARHRAVREIREFAEGMDETDDVRLEVEEKEIWAVSVTKTGRVKAVWGGLVNDGMMGLPPRRRNLSSGMVRQKLVVAASLPSARR